MRKLRFILIAVLGLFPAVLSAQDKGGEKRKFGLTFPNIGIIWNVSDKVAFLPDINLTHGWSDYGTTGGDNKTNAMSVNAALRFYMHDWKGIRFYLSPKYGYGWSNVKNTDPVEGLNLSSELRSLSLGGCLDRRIESPPTVG